MGQKVNPIGYRLGVNKNCDSTWFATKEDYIENLHEDLKIKKYIKNRLESAMISKVLIQRKTKSVTVDIHTARPGQVIGRKGSEIEKIRNELTVLINKGKNNDANVFVNVQEIKDPWCDAKLVGMEIGSQLLRRTSFRRAMKFAIRNALRGGAQGIKVQCAGRLGGAEMARTERYQEGRTPLHTLRADIDYALTEVNTTYGIIGIKVWIYKGDILN
ncbi:MAG: 30S ribosomal protein S3 [Candidatus Cloacimonetes bacterium]|nr:30S ribosomal protein S3 [Candidatus Cloacimonadota bacterium]MCF7814354.1 30S ribosomal protein S3 [Candidatus Cloacimonadota bacterium]MCF7868954.1 30S ribosomal protein S3 [Candidatus Cloacimonadota bacterium]MCF7884348.1 30S ribosomal protein S3 [Candidatus Cloacimonadota bacterium]